MAVASATLLSTLFSVEELFAQQQQAVRNVSVNTVGSAQGSTGATPVYYAGGGQRVQFHFDFVGTGELLVMQYSDNQEQGQAFDRWAKQVVGTATGGITGRSPYHRR